MTIFTIGHSTRTLDALIGLLRAHGVEQVADVRTIPRSRRNPQFNRDNLAAELPRHGIGYQHLPALGGLRHPRADSPNTAWRNDSFRGYADYMSTDAFEAGLDDLLECARARPTAVMCAEAVWWRCHRSLLADALVARGIDVGHITSAREARPHQLNPLARQREGRICYPGLC